MKPRAPSKNTIFLAMCLASILLMVLPAGVAGWLRAAVRPALVPLSHFGMAMTVHCRSRIEEVLRPATAREQAELDALRGQLLAMHQIILNQRRQLDQLKGWRSELEGFRCQLVDAQVVAGEGLPMRDGRVVAYDRGSGVGEGDLATTRRIMHDKAVRLPDKLTVLGSNHVVGRIVEPSAFSATLQLVTDPGFRMPARLWRMVQPGKERRIYVTGPDGGMQSTLFRHEGSSPVAQPVGDPVAVEVQGDGNRIVLRHVGDSSGVEAGDLVATTDSHALLPFGLTIGRVTAWQREKNDAHFLTVFVEPLGGDLKTLREVYIVIPLAGEGP